MTAYRAFDVETGKERFSRPWKSRGRVVAVSLDGTRLLGHVKGGPFRIYDAASGEEVQSIPYKERVGDVVFSPDGLAFALGVDRPGRGSGLKILHTTNPSSVLEIRDGTNYLWYPNFATGGKLLATPYSSEPTGDPRIQGVKFGVCLFDTTSGKLIRRITGLEGFDSGVTFSPDGKLLAVCSDTRPCLQLFDVAMGKEVHRLRCWPGGRCGRQVAFSPNGQTLALIEGECTISLWDVQSGRRRPACPDPRGDFRILRFVDMLRFVDGGESLLVSAGDITVRYWRTGHVVRRLPDPRRDQFSWFGLSAGARVLAAIDFDNVVHFVDGRSGRELHALRLGEDDGPRLLSPDGRKLWTLTLQIANVGPPIMRCWDVATGRELYTKHAQTGGFWTCLAISPDSKVLAGVVSRLDRQENQKLVLWDAENGKELRRLALPKHIFGELDWTAFSPDGSLLAAFASWSEELAQGRPPPSTCGVALWEVATGREYRSVVLEHRLGLIAALSPDFRTLAVGYSDGMVRLWELATAKERHRFLGHTGRVTEVAFTPDGRVLASASPEAPIYIWDLTGTDGHAAPRLTPAERDRLWQGLANTDAPAGFQALQRLLASPEDAITLLGERLKPASVPYPARVRELVQQLDDTAFAVRQNATAELESFGDVITNQLRQALRNAASAEARRRLAHLLKQCESDGPLRLRQIRALELLELLATLQAERMLDRLASGAAGAWLTREATFSRNRLRRRPTE